MAVVAACSLGAASPAVAASHGKHHHHHRHHRRHHKHGHLKRTHHVQAAAKTSAVTVPTAVALVPPCANADTAATSASTAAMDAAVVCLINGQRLSRGLPPLYISTKLDTSAQNWTNWMVSNDQFTHGSDFASRISAVGYDWQTAGENIATGFATPREVVTAWMASTDHCRNILDPSFRDVGTGVVTAPVSGYASDPSTWTQDFGLTMSDSPPSSNTAPQSGCPYNI